MRYTQSWEQSKKRFEALWEREVTDRCCIAVTAPRDKDWHPAPPPSSPEELSLYYTDPEWVLKRHLDRFEHTYFGGDALPCIPIDFGPEAHAGYFGAPYEFAPDTVWFSPVIRDWETDRLAFDPQNSFFQLQKKLAEVLTAESGGRYFVSSSDNDSAIDCLASLRGAEALMMDFYDAPDRIREAQQTVLEEWAYTERAFFEVTRAANDQGSCQAWLNTWSPGLHTHIQCDLSVMLSPAIFDRFVLPELTRMCDLLDHSIYHLDGVEETIHLNSLLSIGRLDMVQWMNCDKQLPSSRYIPILRRIQEAGKALHLFCQPWEVETLLTELSSRGLYLVTAADSPEDAEQILRLAEKLTHE